MRLWTAVVALVLGVAALQSASAASGGFQSGRSGNTPQGARGPHAGLPPIGHLRPAIPPAGIPPLIGPRPNIPRTGIPRPGFRAGLRGGGFIGVPLLLPIEPSYPYDIYPDAYPGPELGQPYLSPDYEQPIYLPPATGYEPPTSQQPGIWYFCPEPMGYYPYVQDCSVAWQVVPASVLPPPQPEQ
jgi:hypothetical protein